MNAGLAWLNALPQAEAESELLKCCGARAWARRLAARRPFRDAEEFFAVADQIWCELEPDAWLEAFRSHPKIGERAASAAPAEARQWSEQEQSGARGASSEVLAALARGNRAYEQRFGYIFIVCATGKSAEEMLALLEQRLQNDPGKELAIAAAEQGMITRLRLEKFLGSG